MLRSTAIFRQAAVGRMGVSPYAVFLIENKGNKALKAASIEARGRKCASAWYALPDDKRGRMKTQAQRMPVFPQRRFMNPRKPPPFGRFVKRYWSSTSPRLSFEDRVHVLVAKYKNLTKVPSTHKQN